MKLKRVRDRRRAFGGLDLRKIVLHPACTSNAQPGANALHADANAGEAAAGSRTRNHQRAQNSELPGASEEQEPEIASLHRADGSGAGIVAPRLQNGQKSVREGPNRVQAARYRRAGATGSVSA